ncbi:hypothetical protein ONS95_001180 [Cadophora gregata]|uniref:uncharacterized protein n=1 Tax=Cadophora gregata TaxID=51156 RepID=UPI0026DB366D|nr:uncharacterized protein ONS95_001180 [Cadophora gregata]KAK0102014.1 hypothetical protein ONS96_005982 [Cadophora gregata f. sp. sojae]KAK0129245.1 hypothetical protein ONS95_001180 [Cadophora gregata]
MAKIADLARTPDLNNQRVYLDIFGDEKMNWRLRNIYEYGSFPTYCDPTVMSNKGRDDKEKHVQIDDTTYLVIVTEHVEETIKYCFWSLPLKTPIIVLTYDVSSKESFEHLKSIYQRIPAPENGKLRLKPGHPHPTPIQDLWVLAKRYPVMTIGCRYPEESTREVEEADVDCFVEQHTECRFVGECTPDEGENKNVDKVFQSVLEVYHELRKHARREEDLYRAAVASPQRKKRLCILQ